MAISIRQLYLYGHISDVFGTHLLSIVSIPCLYNGVLVEYSGSIFRIIASNTTSHRLVIVKIFSPKNCIFKNMLEAENYCIFTLKKSADDFVFKFWKL